MSFTLAMGVYGALSAIGLWCMLFASTNGRISRRTGADKRLGGFPFGNSETSKMRQRKRM